MLTLLFPLKALTKVMVIVSFIVENCTLNKNNYKVRNINICNLKDYLDNFKDDEIIRKKNKLLCTTHSKIIKNIVCWAQNKDKTWEDDMKQIK
jgi:hypothetical protein